MSHILKQFTKKAMSCLQWNAKATHQRISTDFERYVEKLRLSTFTGMRDSIIKEHCQEDDSEERKVLAMLSVLEVEFILFERIMALPRELRDMIYAEIFSDLPTSLVMRPGGFATDFARPFPSIVPAFCYINQQVLEEFLPTVFRGTSITLHESTVVEFVDFLRQVEDERVFTGIEEPWILGHINPLIRACTNLPVLTLEFLPRDFYEPIDPSSIYSRDSRAISDTWMMRRCVPHALFESRRLQVLRLQFPAKPNYARSRTREVTDEEMFARLVTIYRKLMDERGTTFSLETQVYNIPVSRSRWSEHRMTGWGWVETESLKLEV